MLSNITEFTKFTLFFTTQVTVFKILACRFACMKNQYAIYRFPIILLLIINQFRCYAQQQSITYQLDVKQSKILWKAPKNGHFGFILFNYGSLSATAPGKLTGGTFSINMNSMRSTDHQLQKENDQTDELMRSDKYFSVDKHPDATMAVLNISATANPVKFNVFGSLTIKGYSNAVNFMATIKQVKNDIYITADLKIDRMKWHVTGKAENGVYGLPDNFVSDIKDRMIADEIPVSLNLVFHQL